MPVVRRFPENGASAVCDDGKHLVNWFFDELSTGDECHLASESRVGTAAAGVQSAHAAVGDLDFGDLAAARRHGEIQDHEGHRVGLCLRPSPTRCARWGCYIAIAS